VSYTDYSNDERKNKPNTKRQSGFPGSAAGVVTVSWCLQPAVEGDELVLDWVETNGPPVKAPTRRGFGATLIERSLPMSFPGQRHSTSARAGTGGNRPETETS
jgi:two-component sensor histidine kinase